MVTATDDQSDRLSALEAGVSELRTEVRVLSARLSAVEAGVSELRAEIRSDIRALNDRQDRFQAEITERQDRFQAEMTARIDQVAARIDRVFWAVISVGLLIGFGLIGTMLTLAFRLS